MSNETSSVFLQSISSPLPTSCLWKQRVCIISRLTKHTLAGKRAAALTSLNVTSFDLVDKPALM